MADEMNPQPEAPEEAPEEAAEEEAAEEEAAQTPLEQFIFHQRRGLEEFGKAMESLLPPGFREHTHKAGSEFATGFRVLIDAAIDEIKKASEMEDPDARRAAEQERQASANLASEEEASDSSGAGGKIRVELDD